MTPLHLDPELRPPLPSKIRPPLPSKIRPPPLKIRPPPPKIQLPSAARVAGTPPPVARISAWPLTVPDGCLPQRRPSSSFGVEDLTGVRCVGDLGPGKVGGSPAAYVLQLGMRAVTRLELRRWWSREG
jgi:hypothetical protein